MAKILRSSVFLSLFGPLFAVSSAVEPPKTGERAQKAEAVVAEKTEKSGGEKKGLEPQRETGKAGAEKKRVEAAKAGKVPAQGECAECCQDEIGGQKDRGNVRAGESASTTATATATSAGTLESASPKRDPSVEGFVQHFGNVMVDAFLERPVGLVGTVGGFSVFLVTLPGSALGGNVRECWDKLVVRPARHTFARPLGRFEEGSAW